MLDVDVLVARLRAVDWLRSQLLLIAGFHALSAVTLLIAPDQQVVTAGTLPVLELMPGLSLGAHRLGWAVVYAAAAYLVAMVWLRPTFRRQWTAWLVVNPVGFVWAGAFGIAVIDGRGSALGLVIWVTLLCWWGTVAVATGVREPVPRDR